MALLPKAGVQSYVAQLAAALMLLCVAVADAAVGAGLDGTFPRLMIDGASGVCASLWPSGMEEYSLGKPAFAGEGAAACVYSAEMTGGAPVAVKVSKLKGMASLLALKRECGDMHLLRLKACRAGKDLLELHEAYLPTCLQTGEADGIPFLIMHAAPTHAIEEVDNGVVLDTRQREALFGQLVSAVFALHSIGMSHNDLHGQNVVFGTEPAPHLALVDFGEVAPLEKAKLDSYKRDGNAIWRWAAVLAGCELNARWDEAKMGPEAPATGEGKSPYEEAVQALEDCLRSNWNVAEPFLQSMHSLAEADKKGLSDQRVGLVYNSAFVASVRGPLKQNYHWEGTSGCLDWSAEQWQDAEGRVTFGEHFKCDTVPTFPEEQAQSCIGHPSKAACFSTTPGVYWSCGSGLDPQIPCMIVGLPPEAGGGTYDGACLMEGHPGYAYALPWGGEEVPSTSTPEPSTPEPSTPSPTPSPVPDADWDLPLTMLKAIVAVGALTIMWFLLKDKVIQARALPPQPRASVEMNARP